MGLILINISSIKRTVFVGTPDFAVPTLELLAKSPYKPLLVITQPDKPQGRKLRLISPPVKEVAQKLGIETLQPEKIREEEIFRRLQDIEPDIVVTVAYGGFLPRRILQLPRLGCINLHPSLLPQYRGATPINHALFNGDPETGITITRMTVKMDSGPILQQVKVPVKDEDNYSSLSAKLADLGGKQVLQVLQKLEDGQIREVIQDDNEATYCYKLEKADLIIDWHDKAINIHNRVRGLAFEPGAVATFRDNQIKILETIVLEEKSDLAPGKVSSIIKNEGIVVNSQDKKIILTKVQPAGKRIMTGFEFNMGARIERGESFRSGFSD